MKYLGIDFGSKNIGIAISDEGGVMAFPYKVFDNDKNLLEKIKSVVQNENIDVLIVGESKNFKGEPNEIMKHILRFVQSLKSEINIPIFMENEFMTSVQAEKIQGKNKMIDASSATIILQSYLDRLI